MARRTKEPGVGRGHAERPRREFQCEQCGQVFLAARSDARFCSKHRGARQQTRPGRFTGIRALRIGPCAGCGAALLAKRSDALCGDCRQKRRSQTFRTFEQTHKESCVDCGTPITRRGSRCRACEGKAQSERQRGESNSFWKGGRRKQSGYIYILTPDDPKRRYTAEHILVWQQTTGQVVPEGWHVHHLNGERADNRPENLTAMSQSDHHSSRGLVPYEDRINELEQRLVSAGLPIT